PHFIATFVEDHKTNSINGKEILLIQNYISADQREVDRIVKDLNAYDDISKTYMYRFKERKIYDLANFLHRYNFFYIPFPFCKLYKTKILQKYEIYFPIHIEIGEDVLFNITYVQYVDY